MVRGANYRLLGLLPSRLHLFGAENERIYLLGSDAYGRDQLSRFLYGGRVSLFAGLLGAGVTVLLGLCVGAAAGYYGGWRDDLLMRLAELFLALPWLYLLFALRAFLPLAVGPLEAFFLIVAVLGAVGWARPAPRPQDGPPVGKGHGGTHHTERTRLGRPAATREQPGHVMPAPVGRPRSRD